jgi:hypothetical protein
MNLERNEVQALSKTGTPTAGTFTLTYSGQTTAAIAWNATAAAIKTALEALSNISVGDISVSGGPLPNTPVVITFKGTLGNQNIAALTVTPTITGGSFQVDSTTQGNAGATELAQMPISSNQVNLYLDDSYADRGTTQIEDGFSAQISLPEKYDTRRVLDRARNSWKKPVEKAMEPTCVLTLEANAFSDALYATAKADGLPTQYLRADAVGIEIPSATDNFEWGIDLPLKLKDAKENGDESGVDSYTFTFEIVEDDDMDSFFENWFVNNLSSL